VFFFRIHKNTIKPTLAFEPLHSRREFHCSSLGLLIAVVSSALSLIPFRSPNLIHGIVVDQAFFA
jgi:hypothetical protein